MSGTKEWEILGTESSHELVDTRLQLHYAAQLVSSIGATFLDPAPDDSHPNLGWSEAHRALAGRKIPALSGASAALRFESFELLLLGDTGEILATRPLDGTSLRDAFAWLGNAVAREHGSAEPTKLVRTRYELPPHPVADGAAFAFDSPQRFQELARGYANSQRVFETLASEEPGASDVRCWPHHFDLATLITLDSDAAGNPTRTIGVGFSPGDERYAEPYVYVSPWPYPEASAQLPELSLGTWHRDGFTAAVLTQSALLSDGTSSDQAAAFRGFVADAVEISRGLHAG